MEKLESIIIELLDTGEKETVGCFLLPDTIDGCLEAAIEAEFNGDDAKADFLFGMAEVMEENE